MVRWELVRPLPESLARHAAETDARTAFADDTRAVTYADLDARTRRLAGHLVDLGLRRGDRVTLCLGNTVDMIEGYLAVVRACGIGVPLNPRGSVAEQRHVLHDSGSTFVLARASALPQVRRAAQGGPRPVLVVAGGTGGDHRFEELAATEPTTEAPDDLGMDEVAWMFYTSGTSGTPKGVLSTQRNCLFSVAACYVPIPGITPDDRVLWPLPLFHSLSHIACLLGVTTIGATAHIVEGDSPRDVLAALTERRSTVVAGVPATYHQLLRVAAEDGFTPGDLRIGLVGGAVTSAELHRSVERVLGLTLVDAYGSTETCGSIAISPPDGPRVAGSCGPPVPGVDVRVVDPETGVDVPAGEDGEVWVRGPNVMVGYHNSPEATAEVLRDGWLRTGDLARRESSGYLMVRGRVRELIIRGGENIHPVEVESVLRTVPGLADAAVAGRPHPVLGEVPVAYLVPEPAGVDIAEVLAHCRRELSAYKVPHEVHTVRDIPRTGSGKIIRHRLVSGPSRLRHSADGTHPSLTRLTWVPAAPAEPRDWTAVHDLDAARAARADGADPVLVTRYAVVADDHPIDVEQAALWAAAAHLGVARVDLGDALPAALSSAAVPGEPEVALRQGGALVPRLERVAVGAASVPSLWPDFAGTVLVSAADTEAGTAVVRRLVEHRVAGVVLLADTTEPGPLDAELAGAGVPCVRVDTLTADVLDTVSAVIDLSGDPRTAEMLHQATARLSAFVACVPTIPGAPADLDVAVRAAGVEAVVRARAAADDHAVLVHWVDIADLLTAIDVAPGMADTVVVAHVPTLPEDGTAIPAVLMALAADRRDAVRADAAVAGRLRARLTALGPAARERLLVDLVCAQAAVVVDEPVDVEPDRPLRELGFVSTAVVALRNRLVTETGLALATAVGFDYPTPRALAGYLLGRLMGDDAPVSEATEATDEPIAIVGMACLLPGGITDPDELWEVLTSGADPLSPFPTDRGWDLARLSAPDPAVPGRSSVRRGGFLADAGGFDAEFFAVSPREALAMDPQQRLLLEVSWTALEDADLRVDTLRGTDVGVFTGVMAQGYGPRAGRVPADLEGYLSTGGATAVAAGRVAYTFGFEGPAITVDTACSSSLVALHLAAQALRARECSLALAGGATVMATPDSFVEFSRQGALAPDGRCKSFSASADGTGWSEGVGVVVLERLSDARRLGHHVLAVVRGSAVNQDGASNGLTAPSGLAQQRVIRKALAAAGLTASDVDVVEAHGTGTVLGDPIEAGALLATYGQDRDVPLWLGSVKSNLGHTQAAAGVTSVIKMLLALRHGVLPVSRFAAEPSPAVDWSSGAVRLLARPQPWPALGRPRRAGVSAFGASGTNAHVIIEEAPPAEPNEPKVPVLAGDTVPIVVSGRGARGVANQAERVAAAIETAGLDAAAAALARRTTLPERAVVLAESAEEAVGGLRAVVRGEVARHTVIGTAGTARPIVFVFPGQGTQWVGMGRELMASSPVFAAEVDRCAAALRPWVEWSLRDVLRSDDPAVLDRVDVVQPASFAVMVGLAAVWRALGVEPDAVVGHSQGEIAAACVAGALSLADAARVVAVRARRIGTDLAGTGAMGSVALPESEVSARLGQWPGLEIAAINGPASVVVAGPADAVRSAVDTWAAEGVRARIVPVDYASHTEAVDVLIEPLRADLAGVTAEAPRIAFYSTATDAWVRHAGVLGTEHWVRGLRARVRFASAVRALAADGHRVFLEVGAHPVLTQAITETLHVAAPDALVLGSLRRDEPVVRRLLTTAAELFAHGVPVDWSTAVPQVQPARMPGYAFDHRHFWLHDLPTEQPAGLGGTGHPLLDVLVDVPGTDTAVGSSVWSTAAQPWLADHIEAGVVTVPEAALVELAVRVGDSVGASVLRDLTVDVPLTFPEDGELWVRVVVTQDVAAGTRAVAVHCGAEGTWRQHAHAVLDTVQAPVVVPQGAGVDLALDDTSGVEGYGLHPALLDAAARTLLADGESARRWRGVTLHATGATVVRVHADGGRLVLTLPDGTPVLTAELVEGGQRTSSGTLLRVDWVPLRLTEAPGIPLVDVGSAVDVTAALSGDLPDHLVYTVTADDPAAATTAVVAVLHAWLAADRTARSHLTVVTGDSTDIAAAAVWGLVRSAQSEHPGRITLADLDSTGPAALPAILASGEPQVRVRSGAASVPRLAVAPSVGTPRLLNPDGTVLITGGTGTLGALVARHLVTDHGARNLLLVSRRGPEAPGADVLRSALVELGATVSVVACDVTDQTALAAVLDGVELTAVVHAAAALDDGVVTALTPDRLTRVLDPKLTAALALHHATAHADLAAFVLFSSAAGVLGNPGQGNYAAANAGLDALAAYRRAQGLPAVSIAWGYWESASGLTGHLDAADLHRHRRTGIAGLGDADGLALFDAALRSDSPAVLAARLDLASVRMSDDVPPLLRGLVLAARATVRPVVRARVPARPGRPGGPDLLALVREHAAAVLGHDAAEAIRPNQVFREAGFDSLTAVELRNRLATALGLPLSPTLVFDHPTPAELAEHLGDTLAPEPVAAPPVPGADPDDLIAIVAMACRYPGGIDGPEALWEVVRDGVDTVGPFPTDRDLDIDAVYDPDPDRPGTVSVREGGFVHDVTDFDAAFFGISPNEALAMDPQQRLLLETSWELFERAALDPAGLRGSDTGVFVGVNSTEYSLRAREVAEVEGLRLTGGSAAVVSGRIAYTLGLRGPALTVDTACSSSLVSLHLAAQSLRQGECSLAVAGGVMVISSMDTFVEFSRQRGLAPDGRCKAFADAADGTGWSEGVGLLLVERLSDARRNGHPVLAVVRGSAINQDGASNGLTAPSGPAQQRVIGSALAAAAIAATDVDVVEAHGTGTALGDPIEARAVIAAYGRDRTEPLWLGSIKSNIGHTQAAAGVAGVIKMVQAMRHGVLPRTLHVDTPSGAVDWSAGTVALLTEARPWPETGRPRRAGVSAFGISGTNAHVILEQAPPEPAPVADTASAPDPVPRAAGGAAGALPLIFPVSARTPAALRAQADRLARFAAERLDVPLPDIARTLVEARADLDHRAVVVAGDWETLLAGLGSFVGGSPGPGVAVGVEAPGALAAVFTGQGTQWAGMGRGLADAFPVFADALDQALDAVGAHLTRGPSPREVLLAEPGSPAADLIDQTAYTQVTLFAVETALFRLMESFGVIPDLVTGHSVGEIAAAHAAGVLSLDAAAALVSARGALMGSLPSGGAMVAIRAGEDEIAALLPEYPGAEIAAVNAADAVVLSGAAGAVFAFADRMAARGHKTRPLPVSHAFHSALVDPVLPELRAVAARIEPVRGSIPVVCARTGEVLEQADFTPEHWVEQARRPVRFADAVATLRARGATTFLELGPGGALAALVLGSSTSAAETSVAALPRGTGEVDGLLDALAQLQVRGIPVRWNRPEGAALRPDLPTYAFQRERFWLGGHSGGGPRPVDQPRPIARGAADGSLADRLAGLSAAEHTTLLTEVVLTGAAAVLGHRDGGRLDAGVPFRDQGFDSLTAVKLRNRLAEAAGVPLPATLVFDHPTPALLAERLRVELLGGDGLDTEPDVPPITADEPIAVVGMACRFPGGVSTPEQLWDMVLAGRDGYSGFPTDRGWDVDGLVHPDPDHQGTSYTGTGGFLHEAAGFDAAFFGVSPREATAMDPQQRLLLEVSWEALERAGLGPAAADGGTTDIGVYTGLVHHDYATRLDNAPESAEGYLVSGSAGSVASGRVSYAFGLRGPAITVDTACSSSLVSIHLAVQALRSGECAVALAGGATVMSSPDAFVEFSRQRALAVDGRCKPFAAAADGTGWSEGVGVIVLERLSDARRLGHRVLAVVRGSAINQDGASNGLTAPNGPAQQRVIRRALAVSGLRPADVDAVEAHGTGTTLGDPIEAQALMATYGRDRSEPLWLGSVKSNIGHTQAAAGVAGVIKMVLALRHGVLPATVGVDEPTPQVDWSAGAVRLLTETTAWPGVDRPRRAAVSAFGMSGTNAHLILEQAPEDHRPIGTRPTRLGPVPIVVSGSGPRGLAGQAARIAAYLSADDSPDLVDVGSALATRRAPLADRAVVLAGSHRDAVAGLNAVASGETAPGVITGTAGASAARTPIVFVFPGQGTQWVGMGAELLASSAVFADEIDRCAEALAPWVDWSLREVLTVDGAAGAEWLARVDVVQPTCFAVMLGLVAVWRSLGVEPDAVVGHSQGEIAAAYVAGALSLAEAARVVAVRSRIIRTRLSGRGAMASTALSEDDVRGWLDTAPGVEVAAVNGPGSVVVAGPVDAVRRLVDEMTSAGVRARVLPVDYASHTTSVDVIADDLRAELADLRSAVPTRVFHSTVDAARIDAADALAGGYWMRNLRSPVRFQATVAALADAGHGVFVEVGVHPVLVQAIAETLDGAAVTPVVVGTLRRDEPAWPALFTAAAQLFVRGVRVDWAAALPGTGADVDLPTYAFRRQRYWLEDAAEPTGAGTDADGDFWSAVESADRTALSALLDIDAGGRDALNQVMPALTAWRVGRREQAGAAALRYEVAWRPVDHAADGVPRGKWLVVVPASGSELVDGLLRELAGLGLDMILLAIPAGGRAPLAEAIGSVLADHIPVGVLSLLAVDAADGADLPGLTGAALAMVTLTQAAGTASLPGPLWTVTSGAVNTGIDPTPVSPAQAGLWGIGRTAALEHPDRWGGLVDLPPTMDIRAIRALLGVLAAPGDEDQLAVRRSGVYARRLERKPGRAATSRPRPRGTALVTGGAEGLGAHAAARLARSGVRRLVVTTDEHTPEDSVARLRAELADHAVDLIIHPMADRAGLAALLAALPDDEPLTTVVHAADITHTSTIEDTGADDFARVFTTKVEPAVWLDGLLADTSLDAFVVFSSIAGIWGGGGQGVSAAANAALDALVERRRARGGTARALAFGAFDQVGIGLDPEALSQLRRRGVLPMPPSVAVAALDRAMAAGERSAIVADMDWATFLPAFTSVRPSPLFAELPETAALAASDSAGSGSDVALVDSLRAASVAEQERLLLRLVRTHAAMVLGHSGAEDIAPLQAFQEVGFDSLAAVGFRNSLQAATGVRMPATLVFDYPTPAALVDYLRGELLRDPVAEHSAREDEIRRALARVPLARFHETGVLDVLLGLVDEYRPADDSDPRPATEPVDADPGDARLIDDLDVASLVRRALGDTG